MNMLKNGLLLLGVSLFLVGCVDREEDVAIGDPDAALEPDEAAAIENDPVAVMGEGTWTVRQVGHLTPMPGSSITIERFEPGRIAGLASCNRYNASVEADGEGIRILGPATTLMACPDEVLAEQEQHFLEALTEVESVALDEDGQLIMGLASGGFIRARQYLTE